MTLSEFKDLRGLNLTGLASLLGVAVATTHGWLSGKRKPDVKLLVCISKATGGQVSPSDLRPDLAAMFAPNATQKVVRSADIPQCAEIATHSAPIG